MFILRNPDANQNGGASSAPAAGASASATPTDGKQQTLEDVVLAAAGESSSVSAGDETAGGNGEVKEEPVAGAAPEKKETEGQPPAGEKPADGKKPDEKKQLTAEEQAEADKALPFHEHPRWKEVLAERDAAKAEALKVQPELQRLNAIDTYCKNNSISDQQVKEAFEMVALLNRDPKAALAALQKLVGNVELATGARLPEDIQKRLDEGKIDEETARELAQARVEKAGATLKSQSSEQEQQQRIVESIVQAGNAWEQATMKADPAYADKQDLIAARAEQLFKANPPKNGQEATAILQKAYEEVSAKLKRFIPKAPAQKHLGSDGSSTTVEGQPKDLTELVESVTGTSLR